MEDIEKQYDDNYYVISASDSRGDMYKENQCGSPFSVDQDYQDKFLVDIYDPDEYRTKQNFYDNFHKELGVVINSYKKFSYIRSFDMNFLSVGDFVLVNNNSCPCIIECFLDNRKNVIISSQYGLVVESFRNLKPFEKFVTTFIKNHRVELYDLIYRRMKDAGFDHKFYFHVFCEYFKIQDSKEFFLSLPIYHRDLIEKDYRKCRL